jgi:thiol-disulfide isomerase/thioredoxin
MAKPPAKKNVPGQSPSKSANRPPAKSSSAKPAARSGRPAGLFTWVAIGVVVAAVVAIVIVKVTNGSSSVAFGPTSPTIVGQLNSVPASTFDTVGVSSPDVPVTFPARAKDQPMLMWADSHGVKRPTVFYYGAEYCPFCAGERWPMIVALSRFGTWNGLYDMLSSHTDVYPDTPTFSFLHFVYQSQYINFSSVEVQDRDGKKLQTPTADQLAVVNKYDPSGNIPFASIGNQAMVLQASPLPSAFTGTTREQVASVLADPTNKLTKGIIASANFLTASICHIDGQQPAAVCNASGVKTAATTMGF